MSDANQPSQHSAADPEIPLSRPEVTQEDIDAVVSVLQTPLLSLGPKLPEFEGQFARYIGTEHAVAVSSGTAALHLAMIALDLHPGDEVITTPFSFISSANVALMVNAVPVFVDIDPETWNINVHAIKRNITDRTRAILPVHVFGQPARMDTLRDIAIDNGLYLIEDACEAVGASFQDMKVGTFGDVGIFAFYPNKQMTTGEGGMLVTNQQTLADMFRSLRNQGRDPGLPWLAHQRLGYNYRLSDINCALGISQLSRIDSIIARRKQVVQWYWDRLHRESRLVMQYVHRQADVSPFVMVVRLADEYTQTDRDRILQELRARHIGCSNYFAPIHLQPFYVQRFGYEPGMFPQCERIAARTIALPFHTNLSESEVDTVCKTLTLLL